MTGKRLVVSAVALCLTLGAAHWSAAASITLGSDADSYLRDETVRGGFEFMDVRGGSIDFRGYLRFDLSSLGPINITSASLKLTISGGASRNDVITNDRYATYGLDDVVGNTPQNWDESTFVLSSKGTEDVTTLTGVTDLDHDVAGISEILDPAGGSADPGSTVTISGAPLVAFLQGRADDTGLATFILSDDDSADRGFGLATKENTTESFRPMLTLEYEQVIPEPATWVLLSVALAASGCLLRRR